jgi:hypothetical protein
MQQVVRDNRMIEHEANAVRGGRGGKGGEGGGLHLPPPYVSERMELSVKCVRAAEKAGGRSLGR